MVAKQPRWAGIVPSSLKVISPKSLVAAGTSDSSRRMLMSELLFLELRFDDAVLEPKVKEFFERKAFGRSVDLDDMTIVRAMRTA